MGDIAEYAVIPITEKNYPKTYAAWGALGVERINALMQPAAEIVASSPGCDRLELLELSNVRSSPPDNIVFFADCKNGRRFFITESDVAAKRQVVSQNDKSKWLGDQQLLEIAQEEIKARLQSDCHFGDSTAYRAVAGRTVVSVEFKTLSGPAPGSRGVAKCYFDGLSLTEVDFIA
ncbi:hypothetical protein [Acidovorax sp. NB1]|uniref:hypothetical protein n=1 Tax=Acidovorax sp. NB1 TaxID=1943571 RepID=UPI0010D19DFB|nr:hypothetical protein [Acidovorax sp. NB1]GDY37682.1 hypothetical protein ACINB_35740 [Acidovorax sp. NB1]